MTKEEAMKVATEMHQWLKTDREKEALETLVPELRESGDEKMIVQLLKDSIPFDANDDVFIEYG